MAAPPPPPQPNNFSSDPAIPSSPQGQASSETTTPQQNQEQQAAEVASVTFDDPTLDVRGVLGGLPVAEKNQEYIAIIKEAGSTAPEIIDQTQFFVTYLCDSQFNISKPSEDSVASSNIIQNFEVGKQARVRVDQGTALNPQLAGLHNITAVGSIEPILLSQIGEGPLQYVTTMSFYQEGQLGSAPGLTVLKYHTYHDKQAGFRNANFAYETGSYTPTDNQGNPIRKGFIPFQTLQDEPSSSAVDIKGLNGYWPQDQNYFDTAIIRTGSVEGRSRIKVRGAVGINLVSSSVNDIMLSYDPPPTGTPKGYSYAVPMKLKLIKKNYLGVEEVIDEAENPINIFNQTGADLGTNGGGAVDLGAVNNAVFIGINSDYFSVSQSDELFFRVEPPFEQSQSLQYVSNSLYDELIGSFPGSKYRRYQYFNGYFALDNETPQGDNQFFNGVTGITASYQNDGTASVYNYSSSYWVNYQNVSSSEDGYHSFLTASTALTTFYGGAYTQTNPGVESYNLLNADSTPTSSLIYTTEDGRSAKRTSINFGFNPIRLPFVPLAGDWIRFEYSPTKTYKILSTNSAQGTLILKLSDHIQDGTVLDNFVIYRIVPNGQYIILDVKKNNEAGVNQAFTGVITGAHTTEALRERSDSLIFDLKQAGIIEE